MLPAVYAWRVFPAASGLISYVADLVDTYRQAGVLTVEGSSIAFASSPAVVRNASFCRHSFFYSFFDWDFVLDGIYMTLASTRCY
jgi:hypothetical protein